MITEDYVSFETAKLLKEKGFDEATIGYYYTISEIPERIKFFDSPISIYHSDGLIGCIQAPTLQMAMKWLREKKDVQIEITIVGTDTWETPTKWKFGFRCQTKHVIDKRNADFSSYEQACEEAIKYCLENLI